PACNQGPEHVPEHPCPVTYQRHRIRRLFCPRHVRSRCTVHMLACCKRLRSSSFSLLIGAFAGWSANFSTRSFAVCFYKILGEDLIGSNHKVNTTSRD